MSLRSSTTITPKLGATRLLRASWQQLTAWPGSGVAYFVIDCGWFTAPGGDRACSHGDWHVDHERFPAGFAPVTGRIREAGMVPGIWMEAENCGDASQAFHQLDRLLKRDGVPHRGPPPVF